MSAKNDSAQADTPAPARYVRPERVTLEGTLYVYLENVQDGFIRGDSYRELLLLVVDLPDQGPSLYERDTGDGSPSRIEDAELNIRNFMSNLTMGPGNWKSRPNGWEPAKTLKGGRFVLKESMTEVFEFVYSGRQVRIENETM